MKSLLSGYVSLHKIVENCWVLLQAGLAGRGPETSLDFARASDYWGGHSGAVRMPAKRVHSVLASGPLPAWLKNDGEWLRPVANDLVGGEA